MSDIEQFEQFFNGVMARNAVAPHDDQRLYQLANKYGTPSVFIRVLFFMWKTAQHRHGTIIDRAEKR